jgi:hypothetical protein
VGDAVNVTDLLLGGSAWWVLPCSLLVLGATFGLMPGLMLRLIVLLYPKAHPRREELFGELYDPDMGRVERFEWVFQQFETALRQGPTLRKRVRSERQADAPDNATHDDTDLHKPDDLDLPKSTPFGGVGDLPEREVLDDGPSAPVSRGRTRMDVLAVMSTAERAHNELVVGHYGSRGIDPSEFTPVNPRHDSRGWVQLAENPRYTSENPRYTADDGNVDM